MSTSSEFSVMTSGAFTAAYFDLIPQMEDLTKRKIVTASTSVGSGEGSIPNRLRRGEVTDVVIVADTLLSKLIKEGLILEEGRAPVACSSIGMAVCQGAPKPDISSVDGLRRAILQAKSVGYSASVSGEYVTTDLCERLGIVDQVKGKSRLIGGGERVGTAIARGDVEIGFQQMSELLPVSGIAHITPLPPEVQKVSVFSAGVASTSRDITLSQLVIQFLASPKSAPAIIRSGLELFRK
jgi:molybdate transport system substrate-binding protein